MTRRVGTVPPQCFREGEADPLVPSPRAALFPGILFAENKADVVNSGYMKC